MQGIKMMEIELEKERLQNQINKYSQHTDSEALAIGWKQLDLSNYLEQKKNFERCYGSLRKMVSCQDLESNDDNLKIQVRKLDKKQRPSRF